MDKSAIEQIQQSAHIPDLIRQISDKDTQVELALAPDNMTVIDLEKYMPNAARYRLNYSTNSLNDFIDYNDSNADEGSICFIDPESMCAKTVFDMGTIEYPEHKEHKAHLKLKPTQAFTALLNINRKPMPQKETSDFLEDWEDFIKTVFTKDGDAMTPRAAASALRDLSIEAAREVNSKVHDFGESMSAMERIEAKHQNLIPAEMTFLVEPYRGLKERSFKLRVSIITGENKPKISLRILQLEAAEEDMADEFKGILSERFKVGALQTFIGTI